MHPHPLSHPSWFLQPWWSPDFGPKNTLLRDYTVGLHGSINCMNPIQLIIHRLSYISTRSHPMNLCHPTNRKMLMVARLGNVCQSANMPSTYCIYTLDTESSEQLSPGLLDLLRACKIGITALLFGWICSKGVVTVTADRSHVLT